LSIELGSCSWIVWNLYMRCEGYVCWCGNLYTSCSKNLRDVMSLSVMGHLILSVHKIDSFTGWMTWVLDTQSTTAYLLVLYACCFHSSVCHYDIICTVLPIGICTCTVRYIRFVLHNWYSIYAVETYPCTKISLTCVLKPQTKKIDKLTIIKNRFV
jgi:hypothetical protein